VEAYTLLKYPAIRDVTFLGSTTGGKHIYEVAAAHGKRVQALTEAKNHALVLEDCVLERMVKGIVNSTYGCAGRHFMALPVVCVQASSADEEIFGPVTAIKRVKDVEEGMEVMNANRFSNGSCIHTTFGRHAREFAKRTDGGMVGINAGIPVPFSIAPFSGHSQSFSGGLQTIRKDGVTFFTKNQVRHLDLVLRKGCEEKRQHLGWKTQQRLSVGSSGAN
jgi:acyl-CoA reductase-like NAD-dependent aldehyde dehydrogenase